MLYENHWVNSSLHYSTMKNSSHKKLYDYINSNRKSRTLNNWASIDTTFNLITAHILTCDKMVDTA